MDDHINNANIYRSYAIISVYSILSIYTIICMRTDLSHPW